MICPEFRVLKSARKIHWNHAVSGRNFRITFNQELRHGYQPEYVGSKHCVNVGFRNIPNFLNAKNESCIIDWHR